MIIIIIVTIATIISLKLHLAISGVKHRRMCIFQALVSVGVCYFDTDAHGVMQHLAVAISRQLL